ncbi:MAG: hypothetical protein ACFFD4_04300 [Candidatus Odinarchaeota archaeon]
MLLIVLITDSPLASTGKGQRGLHSNRYLDLFHPVFEKKEKSRLACGCPPVTCNTVYQQ